MSIFTNYPASAKRIIGVLLLLNVFCLSALWIGRPDGRHKQNGHVRLIHKMKKELKLSDQQSLDLETMINRHRAEQKELRGKLRELRPSMMQAMTVSPADTSLANSIAIQIGEVTTQSEFMGIRHFEELAKICNAEQQEKLKEIMKRMNNKKHRKR